MVLAAAPGRSHRRAQQSPLRLWAPSSWPMHGRCMWSRYTIPAPAFGCRLRRPPGSGLSMSIPMRPRWLVTYPTYEGVATDLAPWPGRPRRRRRGARWMKPTALISACIARCRPRLTLGADLSAQSPHKLLGALTQASWLLAAATVPEDAVRPRLGVLQTTSPSALLLASLDEARRQIARGRPAHDGQGSGRRPAGARCGATSADLEIVQFGTMTIKG